MGRVLIPKGITRAFGKLSLTVRRHGPEILLVAGTVSSLAGFIWGCVSSTKLEAVIDETQNKVNRVKENKNLANQLPNPEDEYSEAAYRKDLIKVRLEGVKEIAKLYLPSAALVTAGFTGIYASHNMLYKSKALVAAAYAALQSGYSQYRQRVIDAYGEEAEQKIRLNVTEEEIIRPDEFNHPVTTILKKVEGNDDPVIASQYARFFDETSPFYRYITRKTVVGVEYIADTEANLIFITNIQSEMNNLLNRRGYVFLNEVYEKLGLKPSVAGQFVGWIAGDVIDFGLFSSQNPATRRFVNNLEEVVLLDFNVHGDIINEACRLGDWIS